MDKRHFFALSFVFNDEFGRTCNGCSYMGWPTKKVTIPRIAEAKKATRFPDNACLMGVSYLGFMTKAEITGEEPKEPRHD